VGPRTGLDALEKRHNFFCVGNPNIIRRWPSQLPSHHTDRSIVIFLETSSSGLHSILPTL
jgi:hypothetical protein